MSCLGAARLLHCRSAALFPNHGRIVVTQFSIGVGIPLTMFLLKARMRCCPMCAVLRCAVMRVCSMFLAIPHTFKCSAGAPLQAKG